MVLDEADPRKTHSPQDDPARVPLKPERCIKNPSPVAQM